VSLSEAERRLRASLAAHTLHATHDSRELTANARARFIGRFYEQTDPALPHPERVRRAEHLLQAHMKRLALRSAQARRKRAEGAA
jgi:hypothetical protein